MPNIYDNSDDRSKFLNAINKTLNVSYRSDFCVGYFNLRGWKEISAQIDKLKGGEENCCRLIIGMQKQSSEILYNYIKNTEFADMRQSDVFNLKKKYAEEFCKQLEIGRPSDSDETGLKKLVNQLREKKLIVKLFLRYPLHAKLYLMFREDDANPIIGYLGSSNLTLAGIQKQGELNIDVLDTDAGKKLSNWFDDKWEDERCIDITNELIEIIDNSWAGEKSYSPYYIYLKIAYHLSAEARAGVSLFSIPHIFQKELFDFQEIAVKIAAQYLNKRDGVLIGDVVGFGKTYTAAAIAKIYQEDKSYGTLILCPKNLTEMWKDITHKYEIRAEIIPISQAIKKLPKLQLFKLVIIDESHNLRNKDGKRYKAIKEYIQKNGCKVILLSATPYNKTFVDLSNQLQLFLNEEQDLGISPERYIKGIGGATHFNAKHQLGIRSLKAFELSEHPEDWQELMRLFFIRRTREFIKETYAKTDKENNRKYLEYPDGSRSYFTERIPKKIEFSFNALDIDDQYSKLYSKKVVDIINALSLPRYGLGIFINDNSGISPTQTEQQIIANLSRAGKRLMGFCRTNLFKRLESSGYSFLLSIKRHIIRNYIFLYALENNLPIPVGQQEIDTIDEFSTDKDSETAFIDSSVLKDRELYNFSFEIEYYKKAAKRIYELYQNDLKYKKRFSWINSELFMSVLKEKLRNDAVQLIKIMQISTVWDAKKDRKLNAFQNLITQKFPNEKILLFTQYADTAAYLGKILKNRGIEKIDFVTGSDVNPTLKANRFSPISNNRKNPKYPDFINNKDEIRVLISTDVLSEGQNLQDCYIIVNYDLPWAIIRLIQRAGRVDRIGQKSDNIYCYSFLPEDGIEDIINLRGRLVNRLRENDEVIGRDEIFFEEEDKSDTIINLYNEKAGIFDDSEDKEIDISSYAFQIWKTATDFYPELKEKIPNLPNVIYSTKELSKQYDRNKEGAIVYSKTNNDNDILTWVDMEGKMITQSQYAILNALECRFDTKTLEKIPNHHELTSFAIEHSKRSERQLTGQLGSKNSPRYQAYKRLSDVYNKNLGTLFNTDELKKVIQAVYDFPLKESAKEAISRQIKYLISDEDLAEMISNLYKENNLCIVENKEKNNNEPQIICSMGVKVI